MKNITRMITLLMIVIFCLLFTTGCDTRETSFQIRFFDVGQADAALVACDGHYMLIDGGNRDDADFMYSMLKNTDIRHLDLVVGTHPDEDHIGGLAGALNYASADVVLCSTTENDTECFQDFAKYAKLNGNGITIPTAGDSYHLGSAEVHILGVNSGESSNDSSIVLKITYGETSFLFTGDAESAAEQALMNTSFDLSANLLKVAHHGSADSTSEQFLRAVHPDYAVISVGHDNSYLHPAKETLECLTTEEVTFYRTDLQGEITVTSDGKQLEISTEKEASSENLLQSGEELSAIPTFIENLIDENSKEDADENVTRNEQVTADYIINKNSEIFHYPDCESVSKMNEKNKVYFHGTREELLNRGIRPCGNCHP